MEDSERRPPADAVAVTGDGALHKLVLQEGTGEMPPKHARCLGECCSGAGPCNALQRWVCCQRRRRLPPLPLTAGPHPLLHAVHYIGRIAETGEVFMDTKQESPTQEPQEIVSGRGEFAERAGGRCTSETAAGAASACPSRTVFSDAYETGA
jgi:hypothetical protein